MGPNKKYNWCLNKILKNLYEIYWRNVFVAWTKYSLALYFLVLCIFFIAIMGLSNTIITNKTSSAFLPLGILFGTVQVSFVADLINKLIYLMSKF